MFPEGGWVDVGGRVGGWVGGYLLGFLVLLGRKGGLVIENFEELGAGEEEVGEGHGTVGG